MLVAASRWYASQRSCDTLSPSASANCCGESRGGSSFSAARSSAFSTSHLSGPLASFQKTPSPRWTMWLALYAPHVSRFSLRRSSASCLSAFLY